MADDEQLAGGCAATPLLFLLDGVLSQDVDRVGEAVREIGSLGCPVPAISPCTSRVDLCEILSSLLGMYLRFASMRSEHDGSLPLHFAASLGVVSVAQIILAQVRVRSPSVSGVNSWMKP